MKVYVICELDCAPEAVYYIKDDARRNRLENAKRILRNSWDETWSWKPNVSEDNLERFDESIFELELQ